jgi:hypothetical protein
MMLHKDYDRNGSVKKSAGRKSQEAWRQDELIGGKRPVVKWLWHWLSVQMKFIQSNDNLLQ